MCLTLEQIEIAERAGEVLERWRSRRPPFNSQKTPRSHQLRHYVEEAICQAICLLEIKGVPAGKTLRLKYSVLLEKARSLDEEEEHLSRAERRQRDEDLRVDAVWLVQFLREIVEQCRQAVAREGSPNDGSVNPAAKPNPKTKDCPVQIPDDPPTRGAQHTGTGNRHSCDYRSVVWNGQKYTFTPSQAAAVKILWDAYSNGTPAVGQAAILEGIDSDADRLRDVFRSGRHPAWRTMIVPSGKGVFRLSDSH